MRCKLQDIFHDLLSLQLLDNQMDDKFPKVPPEHPKREGSQLSSQSQQGRRRKRSSEMVPQNKNLDSSMNIERRQKLNVQSERQSKPSYHSFQSNFIINQTISPFSALVSPVSTDVTPVNFNRRQQIQFKHESNKPIFPQKSIKSKQQKYRTLRTLIENLYSDQSSEIQQTQAQFSLANIFKQMRINCIQYRRKISRIFRNSILETYIEELCKRYLWDNKYFNKIMMEIFFNIINYETFIKDKKDNTYIMMNNSLKNSNLLRLLSFKYNSKDQHGFSRKKKVKISLSSQIDYKAFYQQVNNHLPSLEENLIDQFKGIEQNKNQYFVQYLFNNLFSKSLSSKLVQELKPIIKNSAHNERSQGIIIKLIIIQSIKLLIKQTFNCQQLDSQFASKQICPKIRKSLHLAAFSKIPQFQLCIQQKDDLNQFLFLIQKNENIFTEDAYPKCIISYFLQILFFLRQCLNYGFGICIEEENFCVRKDRFAYRITKPFELAKRPKDLQTKNKQLSILMQKKKIDSKKQTFFNYSKLSWFFTIFELNLRYLKNFYQKFIKFLSVQQIGKQHQYIPQEFSIIQNIYDKQKVQIITDISRVIHQLKKYRCNYSSSINDNKGKNELLEIFFTLKIELIMRKIYNQHFCKGELQFNSSVYNEYISLISHTDEPLKVIYNNLFPSQQKNQCRKMAQDYSQENGWRPNTIRQSHQSMVKVANLLLNINQNNTIFSGILGLRSIKNQSSKMIEVIQQSRNKQQSISFRQLKPEQGRNLLYKKMFPRLKSELIARQKKPIQQLDATIEQIAKQFINNTIKSFNNLSAKHVYSPLILMRHFILHKYATNGREILILPQFNVFSSIIQKNLENPIRLETFTIQYHINSIIQSLNLPIVTHNRFICIIFLRFLTSHNNQRKYLQQVYTFITQFVKDNKMKNINREFNIYFTRYSNNARFQFIKNHWRKIAIRTSQLLNFVHDINEDKQGFNSLVSEQINKQFNKKYSLISNQQYSKSQCYLIQNLQSTVSCFVQVQYRKYQQNLEQIDASLSNPHFSRIFYTHAINMLFLYRNYCQIALSQVEQLKHLLLVCEQDIVDLSNMKINYQNSSWINKLRSKRQPQITDEILYQEIYKEFQKSRRNRFTVRFKLTDYMLQFCYQQMQQQLKDNLYFKQIIIQKNEFFQDLSESDKTKLLQGFLLTLEQARKLYIQVWNFNIRTVQLSTNRYINKIIDHQGILDDQFLPDQIFLRPTFCCWQWHRNFTKQLRQKNKSCYFDFYCFLKKISLKEKKQFYFQKDYNVINFPPYHDRQVNNPGININFRQFFNYSPGYDVGCMGYTIAFIVLKLEDNCFKDHFLQKILLEYFYNQTNSHQEVRKRIDEQLQAYSECNLIYLINNMINPIVSQRKIYNLKEAKKSGLFDKINKIEKKQFS